MMGSDEARTQTNLGKRAITDIDFPSSIFCSVVPIDHTNLLYRVCSQCERSLPEPPSNPSTTPICKYCTFNNKLNPSVSASKRLFRVLVSIASDKKVFVVVMFDRAAKVLFGCSADEFFDFAKTHPFAGNVLEGEMLKVSLSKPKNGNAQHMRVASVVPLRSGFQPVIETLRQLYCVRASS